MFTLNDLPKPIVRYAVGLWTRRWLVLSVAWLVAVAGWLAIMLMPDAYESRAQIYVDTDTALNETLEESARRADFEKRVRVMTLQLLSRENLEQVIAEVGIDEEFAVVAAERAPGNAAEQERIRKVLLQRKIKSLGESIRISSSEEQYYTISYLDRNPVMAQRIVAAVIALFIEKDVGTAISQSETALSRLDREIRRYEALLSQKDQEVAAFRKEHADELTGNETQRRRLDQKEGELSGIEFSIEQSTRRRQTLMGELATTPRNTSGTELDQLKLQMAQLQSQYRDNYPDIIALRARIAELENGGASLPNNPEFQRLEASVRVVEDELAVLRQRQAVLRSEIEQLTLTAGQVPAVQAELQEIMRNYDQIEASYEDLLSERERQAITASLSEGGGTVDYNLYEAPTAAAEPAWPPRGLMSLGVFLVALGAGVGIAFLLAQIDRSYTQVSDLEEALGLPVLGAISPAQTPSRRRDNFFDRTAIVGVAGLLFATACALFWLHEIHVDADDNRPGLLAASEEL
ncbi:XrtA system polysaccharide chain length determinant [Aquisalinus flavus]|uniref:Polysaccharide chain length determinant N-terminal domain-containing protein n=1 Tax=Aquisalinus flavus TaxID=1526572 RepID=A0A8J2Y4P3_9PROT|nr:XrtA system polysaccharide chain length determinant [Aquisalinus flavus]MBD0427186.1 hypothetical protein [Aquisalinus flavus]GGC99039.1 hypothetical protein GCM10011342_05000 [Aquisalinus flavus]